MDQIDVTMINIIMNHINVNHEDLMDLHVKNEGIHINIVKT